MKNLYIDTSDNSKVIIKLSLDGQEYKNIKVLENIRGSQVVLQMIDLILREQKTELNQLNEFIVNTGPGSFTGLRVGCAIANALAYSTQKRVNSLKVGEFVAPKYE